jgi:hypothetical protein
MASKRKRLTLKEKIDILEFRTSNTNTMDVRALADKFSVGKTQIANIIANTDALYKTWAENGDKRKWTKLQKTETSIIGNRRIPSRVAENDRIPSRRRSNYVRIPSRGWINYVRIPSRLVLDGINISSIL